MFNCLDNYTDIGGIAQSVEQTAHIRSVGGSSPSATISIIITSVLLPRFFYAYFCTKPTTTRGFL